MPGRLLEAIIGQIDRSALFLRRLAHAVRSDGAAFFTISPIRNARRIAAMCKARSLEAEGELERSASEWNAVLQSHPDARMSYLGYGRILRKLNRAAESRAVLSRAIERFPRDIDVMLGLALTMRRAAPLAEAMAQARDVVARDPREPRGHLLLGRIYRDADLVDQADETLLAGRRTCPGDLGLAREYAIAADGRWPTALSRWQDLRQDFPAAEIGYAGLGAVLKHLKRFDEADDVLARGMARFPADDNIGVNHAWVAEDREDWPEALRRWESLWQRFPGNGRIEIGLVECRGKAGAAAPLPEALAEARGIVARHPREPRGHLLLGRIYRDAGLVDQADETLLAGRRTCPGDLGLALEYAIAADGRWPTALSRWQDLRQDFPAAEIGYAGLGAVLKHLKRFDEADDVLARGMARFPADDNIGVNYAWVAEDREDWSEALRRWESLWQRFPGNGRIQTGLVWCRGKVRAAAAFRALEGGDDAEAGPPISPFQTTKTGPSLEYADLFMRFESVGENCEFGFVQRHFGAEPLGLFRWGGLPFDRLLQGLSSAFQDLGRTETTELHVNADTDEYFTKDRASGLLTHGFMSRNGTSEEVALSRLRRRLGYLRDKFLEDVAAREKIFVFTSLEPLEDRAFRQLNDAMARHGAVDLLCMRLADETRPPGTVYLVAGGPMVGHLDRLGFDGKNWNISFDVWRQVCQRAAATVEVGRRPQG